MILDGYWKKELKHIIRRLSWWSNIGGNFFQEFVEHKVNRYMLLSAAIVRKIYEEEESTKKEINKGILLSVNFPILDLCVSARQYDYAAKDKLFVNSKVFTEDYNLEKPQDISLALKHACNQIIHSYVWGIVYTKNRNIYGVLLASDSFKDKFIYLLSIENWISVLKKVEELSTI